MVFGVESRVFLITLQIFMSRIWIASKPCCRWDDYQFLEFVVLCSDVWFELWGLVYMYLRLDWWINPFSNTNVGQGQTFETISRRPNNVSQWHICTWRRVCMCACMLMNANILFHVFLPSNGPLARYVKLRVAHAPGMPGTFSPPPTSKETAS